MYDSPKKGFFARNLFIITLLGSLALHGGAYAAYYISQFQEEPELIDSSTLNQEVDIMEEVPIPPELLGGTSSPAPVEKSEWVEGKKKGGDDPADDDLDPNKISGNGTDKDGYLYSWNGDRVPTPIIDFDLRDYFPKAAKDANITERTVTLSVQIDENGNIISSKIVSGRAGYGFDEAAMKIMNRIRFTPGYVSGKPTRMAHRVPITFSLDD